MSFVKTTASVAILAAAATAASAQGREQVQVAGSSTVLPYANIVAEAFGESYDFPTPVIQSGGSSRHVDAGCVYVWAALLSASYRIPRCTGHGPLRSLACNTRPRGRTG